MRGEDMKNKKRRNRKVNKTWWGTRGKRGQIVCMWMVEEMKKKERGKKGYESGRQNSMRK